MKERIAKIELIGVLVGGLLHTRFETAGGRMPYWKVWMYTKKLSERA